MPLIPIPAEKDFADVRARLQALEKAYLSRKEDSPWSTVERPDGRLFDELLSLSRDGLKLVQKNREYFLTHHLYDDGMYWYRLFELISASAAGVKRTCAQKAIQPDSVSELIRIVVDMSEYAGAVFCIRGEYSVMIDIHKRNQEALSTLLYAFEDEQYFAAAKTRESEIGLNAIFRADKCTFVELSIRIAKRGIANYERKEKH
ncbi:MAG: hypothetical protein A3G34_07155 [Candidatus Lindowbacteria bacterium RIFCSPLOWO2_12_FULL_62_27]|nr:MAG: hypothetical protein A3G34_07155 [Candidatus Lindowbacteria bacterium RIFCSPLOWO2_12_FULL_62_27]OGH61811.1 MAG: hypothetical protein A3I06_09340 [Candidatus Lindowbacteria bacterium RIFCSPLOWO2_02_FULL_62_12]